MTTRGKNLLDLQGEEVNRWLEFKIGEAFSLKRVSHLAREELRMSEPTAIRYVHVVPTPTEP